MFRKHKREYKNLARELLQEISKQIKEFFVSKGIYPNPARLKLIGNAGKDMCRTQVNKNGQTVNSFQNPVLAKLREEHR